MNRPFNTILLTGFLLTVILFSGCRKNKSILIADNGLLKISVVNSSENLWEYTLVKSGKTYAFQAPVLEIDGKLITALSDSFKLENEPVTLKNGV
jgi:hypothetical protein